MLILTAYANLWGGNNITSGYYIGDGTGYYNIKVVGSSSYRNVSCISSTPREIVLPISPRVLILIADSTQSILIVTSSTSLYYYLSGAATWYKNNSGSSSNNKTIGPVQYSAVSILDNKLQLLNTTRVTSTEPADGGTLNFLLQHIYSTYDANNSDNNIEAALYNNANEKYYYIAW